MKKDINITPNTIIDEIFETDHIKTQSKKFNINTVNDLISNTQNDIKVIYAKDSDSIITIIHKLGYVFKDEPKYEEQTKRNKIYSIPITKLNLSVRAMNCLKRKKINTLGELLEYSIVNKNNEKYLGKIRNLGQATMGEIIKKVHDLGYFFKDELQHKNEPQKELQEINAEEIIIENKEIKERIIKKEKQLNKLEQLIKEKQQLLEEEQALDEKIKEALKTLQKLTGDIYVKTK